MPDFTPISLPWGIHSTLSEVLHLPPRAVAPVALQADAETPHNVRCEELDGSR